MPMTSKEIIRLLEQNGFVCVRQNGSHKFFINDKTKKMTTVPSHNRDLPKGTEQKILKDAGLKLFTK
ncbi:type II toxin-antitoxin system HicA family toxin [Sedimentibacter hydroxybenzoicus DSM 7310]|uniref:Type II toxin-antitoxin system HicA family toxin n=1 Tax=Sedimentibacter hydroxybenzoicus DSM 7310 TaxID=1123245 RepID=A0A974BIL6_SEDHY|nr:type II toxin-antitoxin system HicA family toxin [Sedimentibacter hydroxybenzoicus]NYB73576.1 type II toxin-antitoxin system HicA family toxin [Sedimentibacter hydroxybenzoicus DSM 7310]